MKSLMINIFFIFFCMICNAQNNCRNDSIMYLIAYNYIVNDSINYGKSISVADSIIDLDRFWFSKDLVALPVEREKLVNYHANKKYISSAPFYSPCIALLFGKKIRQSNVVLFFSKIEDNMLRADLLPCKKYGNKYNYDQMSFQNEGQIYLFVFDKNGDLKGAFSHEIIYD
ncbi:hypothetical protein [Bacteroides bouchesdurhonensis]|uniref:hypothetical protein n=1 Tax=Bacteroides bouchesdurhonensis TaxID=1841855 RepID=UPI0011DD81A4|nr:hypothetical protein [Bacteroides bouchesdurhonensis]